jgi:hypothetical protein
MYTTRCIRDVCRHGLLLPLLVARVGGDVGELPDAAEERVGVQGSFDCACGFIRRIRMLRSG